MVMLATPALLISTSITSQFGHGPGGGLPLGVGGQVGGISGLLCRQLSG